MVPFKNLGGFMELKIKLLSKDATLPTRANPEDAGLDLSSSEEIIVIKPGEGRMIKTDVAIALPPNTVGMICDRSSMGKKGLKVHGGIVDVPYRGEVRVILWNHSGADVEIKKGDRIAQILVIPILLCNPQEVSELDETSRGNKGFGSSGR